MTLDMVKCIECGVNIREDECIWIDPFSMEASTGKGAVPYCVPCCPEQTDTESDSIQETSGRSLLT